MTTLDDRTTTDDRPSDTSPVGTYAATHQEDPLLVVLATARASLDGEVSTEIDVRSRARVLEALEAGRSPGRARRGRTIAFAGGGLAFVAAIAAIVLFWLRPAPPIGFSVDGSPQAMSASGVAIEAKGHDAEITFDDGSLVAFRSGSSGRVASVTSRGARIVVAAGRAHFDVWHRPDTEWSVEAGKYVVRVTGTAFDVDWSPSRNTLRVTMARGSVVVEGAGSPVVLSTGQVLDLDGGSPVVSVVDSAALTQPQLVASAPGDAQDAAPSAVAPEPAVSITDARETPTPTTPSTTPSSPAAPPRESWSARVARGDYRIVVDEAHARGEKQVLANASLEDLGALAEAARYDGKPDLARGTLESVRSRFPDSALAHTAAFLLGRIAEDNDGAGEKAVALYDDYLTRGGPFAPEALGRKMIAVHRASGAKAAEPIAREYLATYPKGTYAGAARSILGEAPQ